MKKKIASIAIAALTMVSVLHVNVAPVEAATKTVPDGYTPIYTIEDLYGINDDLEGNYILMNDIDLSETAPGGDWDSGHGWTPIGYNRKAFGGIFDGAGHHITNMQIYSDTTEYLLEDGMIADGALFYSLNKDSIIENLALEEISIKFTGRGTCGGIACYSTGVIKNCYVSGEMYSASGSKGSIVAELEGIVENCYATADVSGKVGSAWQVGKGGIVGYQCAEKSRINNCYFAGTVTKEQYYEGPVVGQYFNEALIWNENNYYSSKVGVDDSLGKKSANPIKLTPAQMKSPKCFTGFDFKNIWTIDKYSSYPYPQLKSCMQVRTTKVELLSAPKKLSYTTADKLDLAGSKVKITYEDGYSTTTALTEDMLSYKMKEGEQTVKVSYNGCKADSFKIKVKAAKESLKVTSQKTSLKIGQSFQYKVKYVGSGKVIYSSNNVGVLKIDKSTGKATAKKAGTATITVTAGKCTQKIKVTVKK